MDNEYTVIFCTCPDVKTAEDISENILQKKVAACVNIINGLTSKYWWQGKIVRDSESLMIIKSKTSHFNRIKELIESSHPYEVPEIIRIAIKDGNEPYLKWIDSSVK